MSRDLRVTSPATTSVTRQYRKADLVLVQNMSAFLIEGTADVGAIPFSRGGTVPPFTGRTRGAIGARDGVITITFDVHTEHAPAFRSAVEEIVNEVGGRLEGMYSFAEEQALTDAAVALASLKTATIRAIPKADPHYRGRRR